MIIYSRKNNLSGSIQAYEIDLSKWPQDKAASISALIANVIADYADAFFHRSESTEYDIKVFAGPKQMGYIQQIRFDSANALKYPSLNNLVQMLEDTCPIRDSNGNRCSLPLPCRQQGH